MKKPRLGQHFLIDEQIVDAIVTLFNPRRGERIIEIGPGHGVLTLPLLARGAQVIAVEIDAALAGRLRAAAGPNGSLTVLRQNALRLDLSPLAATGPLRLIGNLPYGISSPLLFHLRAQLQHLAQMTFMLQREVAERLCAASGSRTYGRLSVALQCDFEIERHFDVPPEAFRPAPQVVSSVITCIPRRPPANLLDRAVFDQLLARAFGQRRKVLRNALAGILESRHWQAAELDPGMRAEAVPVAKFVELANLIAADRSHP